MKILVDVAMLAVLAALGFELAGLIAAAFQGDHDELLYVLEMTPSTFDVPAWFIALVVATAAVTWVCLVFVFWPLHRIIWLTVFGFADVGSMLKHSAYACFGFWGGSTLLFSIFPLVLAGFWTTDASSESAFVPLGLETIFFVMALTFLAIGRTLERAESVEEENSQFL